MSIAQDRFCINRKIAPNLNIESFFRLVKKCGLNKVELRNDMPSGKVTDELSSAQLNALAEEYDIEIVTINALQRFNLPEHRPTLLKACYNKQKRFAAKGLFYAQTVAPVTDDQPNKKNKIRWMPWCYWLRYLKSTT